MDTVPPHRPGPGYEPTVDVPAHRAPTAWTGPPLPPQPPLPGGAAATRWTAPPGGPGAGTPAASPFAVPRLVPGLQLGPWRLQAELGRGGMGAVWRATDLTLGREVALKVLLDLASQSPEARARFLREGQLAARVTHPGIVRIYAVGEAPVPWLACELIEGARPLTAVTAERPLAQGVVLVEEAARALGFAHSQGIVHRDVKPDNLLVGRDGRVRVSDFGISTAYDVERLTNTGRIMGTPAYMAPEQLEGSRSTHGPWTDVWALGVVLYEVLTGERPFGSGAPMEIAARVLQRRSDADRSPRTLRPDVPRALEAVVLRALAFEPQHRWRDGEAFADALEAARSAPERAARRAWRLGAVPGLALGAAALVAAGWVLGRGGASPPPPPPTLPVTPPPPTPPPAPVAVPEVEPASVAEVWSKTVAISFDSWDEELEEKHRDLHVIWMDATVRQVERELVLGLPGTSMIQLRFYLEGEPTWARLELHHIASEIDGKPGSFVGVDVNDQQVEARLAPTFNDALDITRFVRPGENTFAVRLHPDSRSSYWFRNVRLRYGAGAPP